MMHPDGKFEYCNIMLHVILKLSYEFARWQHVCHNVDTSSNHLKSILTRNEYTSLTNRKIQSLPTRRGLSPSVEFVEKHSSGWLLEFTMAFW